MQLLFYYSRLVFISFYRHDMAYECVTRLRYCWLYSRYMLIGECESSKHLRMPHTTFTHMLYYIYTYVCILPTMCKRFPLCQTSTFSLLPIELQCIFLWFHTCKKNSDKQEHFNVQPLQFSANIFNVISYETLIQEYE